MERKITEMSEEKRKMEAEINGLKDKLEEEVWARNRLEGKIEELAERLRG